MRIIGLGNRARQGKDTAGEAIRNYYEDQNSLLRSHSLAGGTKVFIAKFASALYDEARTQHGMTEKDPVLLQNIGMARRAEDPDYWVKRAFASIPADTNLVIFTDTRFKNEAETIKHKGGHLIRVVRLNDDGTFYYATDRPQNHQSEIELDTYNWDFEIHSKSAVLTGEMAITIAEYIRGLEEAKKGF